MKNRYLLWPLACVLISLPACASLDRQELIDGCAKLDASLERLCSGLPDLPLAEAERLIEEIF